jgi:hypothetical protein
MSWVITPGWSPADADAAAYITAVETADNQALENGVKVAIDNFVLGCKADGIWTAIKASCILAGARTLTGALVPLVGTAPTNVGGLFVAGDYNRKTGLVGNGSTKYLNSNRNNNADPQDNNHQSIYLTSTGGVASMFRIGAGVLNTGSTSLAKLSPNGNLVVRSRDGAGGAEFGSYTSTGLFAASRAAAGSVNIRSAGSTISQSRTSQTTFNGNVFVFASNTGSTLSFPTDDRIAFYSIGESLDVALLDARVTTLINAFDAAI